MLAKWLDSSLQESQDYTVTSSLPSGGCHRCPYVATIFYGGIGSLAAHRCFGPHTDPEPPNVAADVDVGV